jgi:hypothetical protein
MRNQRTREEIAVINLVSETLRQAGHEVIEDTNFHDKPDWVFSLNGKRVAAECRLISLQELMKWSNSKRTMIPEKNYKIIFPIEPHLWIKKAIEDKKDKIPEYLKNSSAEEVWLITHADFTAGLTLYECSIWMLDVMRSAAASIISEFSSIWFVHPESGANELWDAGEPRADFSLLDSLTKDCPVASYSTLIGTLRNEDWSVTVGPENTIETITLQPLDKRYKIEEE